MNKKEGVSQISFKVTVLIIANILFLLCEAFLVPSFGIWPWVFKIPQVLLNINIIYLVKTRWATPFALLAAYSKAIAQGTSHGPPRKYPNEWATLANNLYTIDSNILHATEYSRSIGEGHFDSIHELDISSGLGNALHEMKVKLSKVSEEEQKRNWAIAGVAKFGQLFREHLSSDVKFISDIFISGLVKYLKANQGGIFIINDQDRNDVHIEPVACYAYERKKFTQARLELQEGLVGQCIFEKEFFYLDDVPEGFATINSGLGQSEPVSILLVPVKSNDIIYGVIELAFFDKIGTHEMEFVKNIAESFASTLFTLKSNHNTQQLLSVSQNSTTELQLKEQELVRNELDLREAQEKLNYKFHELEIESNLNSCILTAINKSNACIEFDMEGNILDANEMFLSVMGFTKSEILGKNERMLVPADELESQRYDLLWDSIRLGNFNTGEFKRYSKSGKILWVEATYNPIMDLDNKAYKILMFALFTTEAKEKEIKELEDTYPYINIRYRFHRR